jgi:hypothetical protein
MQLTNNGKLSHLVQPHTCLLSYLHLLQNNKNWYNNVMATKYVQDQPHFLDGAGVTVGDTTMTLVDFLGIDGDELTMADFGDIGYATLEPGNGTQEEQVSFTGVTQNANGTATLTGIKSVLFTSPYTETAGFAKSHAGGTRFVISNTSGFYNKLAALDDDESVTGIFTFIDPAVPRMDQQPAYGAGTELYFATKEYVDDVAIAGAPNASTTVKGIAQEATMAQIDADTAAGSTGARLFTNPSTLVTSKYGTRLPSADEKAALVGTSGTASGTNKYVTNDDTSATAAASKVVRSGAGSKIAEGYLQMTDTQASTLTSGSTSDAQSLHTHNNLVKVLGKSFTPVTYDGSGEDTLYSLSVTGGTLGTDSGIKFEIPISDYDTDNSTSGTFRLKYGTTTIATAIITASSDGNTSNLGGYITGFIYANASANAQYGSITVSVAGSGLDATTSKAQTVSASGTATENSASTLNLSVTFEESGSNASVTVGNVIWTRLA